MVISKVYFVYFPGRKICQGIRIKMKILLDEYALTILINRAAAELFCFKTVKTYTTQDKHTKYCETCGLVGFRNTLCCILCFVIIKDIQ